MTVTERIFELIKDHDMTQREFSKKTGIPQTTISDWKKQRSSPSADKIMIICDVLDTTPQELFSLASDESQYETVDYIHLSRNSDEYYIIETYRHLPSNLKNRMLGYVDAKREDMI